MIDTAYVNDTRSFAMLAVSVMLNINQWHVLLAAHIFSVQALLSHLDYSIPNTTVTQNLRKVFVFPDSHKIHHDSNNPETNYGFLFSFWDFIFGTKGKKIDSNFNSVNANGKGTHYDFF
tara:strand:+ start:43616 stop:43972 length:357 start_codon:yes stop_codon:yes gene_type:complete